MVKGAILASKKTNVLNLAEQNVQLKLWQWKLMLYYFASMFRLCPGETTPSISHLPWYIQILASLNPRPK